MTCSYASLAVLMACCFLPDVARADVVTEDDPQTAAPERYETPRVRVAVEGGSGYFSWPRLAVSGFGVAAHARIGTQVTSMFSIVYQGGVGFLHLVYDGEQGDDWDGGVMQGSALAMLTFGGTFEIGAGPALDLYLWTGHYGSGSFSEPSFAPGAHARVAAHFPGWVSRRPSFVLGLDTRAGAHPTHHDDSFTPVVTGELTAGAEWH